MDRNDLKILAEGRLFRVAITKRAFKEFCNADAKARARILRYMGHYANDGPPHLDDTKYKLEGRFSTGDASTGKVAICAFKAWQTRVYGGMVELEGRNTFICTEVDISKKQDRADQGMLERAARKLGDFIKPRGERG